MITGISGQDGAYLSRLLLEKGYEVYGLLARRATATTWRLEELGVLESVRLLEGDLTDFSSLISALKESRADEVYNLAAQSFVGTSWRQPLLTGQVTGLGAVNLLEATRLERPEARFYQASTSEQSMRPRNERPHRFTPEVLTGFPNCTPTGRSSIFGKATICIAVAGSSSTTNRLSGVWSL